MRRIVQQRTAQQNPRPPLITANDLFQSLLFRLESERAVIKHALIISLSVDRDQLHVDPMVDVLVDPRPPAVAETKVHNALVVGTRARRMFALKDVVEITRKRVHRRNGDRGNATHIKRAWNTATDRCRHLRIIERVSRRDTEADIIDAAGIPGTGLEILGDQERIGGPVAISDEVYRHLESAYGIRSLQAPRQIGISECHAG